MTTAVKMTPAEYLESAKERGLSITLNGTLLLVTPKNLVTDEDRKFIKAYKSAIVRFLMYEFIGIDPDELEEEKIIPPPGAQVYIADADGYMNERRKGEPYMWCWEGGKTWYYVKDHTPP